MILKKILAFPATPILAVIYPFLYYCSVNIVQIKEKDITRTLVVIVIGSVSLLMICWLCTKNWNKSAIISAWVATLFFLYGQLYHWILPSRIFLARHSILLPLFLLLMLVIPWLVWRSRRDISELVRYCNILLVILTMISAFPVVRGLMHYAQINKRTTKHQIVNGSAAQVSTPDVYLIIMDGYARDDLLREYYHFDNSPFLEKLQSLGFATIPCSTSNYRWTIQSISSMLNFDYLNDINGDFAKDEYTDEDLRILINNSRMRNYLEERGYQTVALETGYPFTDLTNASQYYPAQINKNKLTNFESGFVETTILVSMRSIAYRLGLDLPAISNNQDEYERSPEYFYNIKISGFNSLDSFVEIPSPKFVFAHLIATHRPYNMDENGDYIVSKKLSSKAYTQQVTYTNKRIISSITKILAESKNPPIIILLSDHGIRINVEDAFKNFIAVYASPKTIDNLYATITPINVMRIVFANEFGSDVPIIPDLSFNQEENGFGDYELIPNHCNGEMK